METFWFCAVAVMVAMYVVLDGFDLGVGALHLWAARTEPERRMSLRAIGPVWDGNEVWLLAAGGVLYFAFPALYASSFSGFYLPLIIVLWLLILRGIAIELRNHLDNAVWRPFWDVVFSGASALLAVFFGAALGNVVRGVPLDADGYFFLPLWTHFGVRGEVGILDWYTVLAGVAALVTLLSHGAHWLALKTAGPLAERAEQAGRTLWPLLVLLTIGLTAASFAVQPQLGARFVKAPGNFVFPALAVAALVGMRVWRDELKRFLASCAFILGMLTSAAAGVYPYVLPSHQDAARGLTIYNAAAPQPGLSWGLYWWAPGMLLVTAYFVFAYRNFAGKVSGEEGGHY